MGVFTRSDSKYLWIYLETAPPGVKPKQRTDFLIGHTAAERKANYADALAVYGEKMSAIGKGTHGLHVEPDAMTFDAFADYYEAHIIPLHRGHLREQQILKRLRADFGRLLLTDPRWRERVIAWRTVRLTVPTERTRRLKSGRSKTRIYPPAKASTVNREVGLLQMILAKAEELKHLPRSPLRDWEDLDEATPKRRTLSEDEETRILVHLDPVDRTILIMALDTLARFGDVLDLRYQDDHGTEVYLSETKNGEPNRILVSARLRAALDAIPPVPGQDYVFAVRRRGETPENCRRIYMNALERACKQADVPYGRKVHGVTFHWGTRRTGASRMLRRGGTNAIGIVQRIGGWKTLKMLTEVYQEVTVEDMRAAVESVAPVAGNRGNRSGMETPKTGRNGSKRVIGTAVAHHAKSPKSLGNIEISRHG